MKREKTTHPLVFEGTKACFFTGHRPKDKAGVNFIWEYKLPGQMNEAEKTAYDQMNMALDKAILFAYERGCRTFITGMALGTDLYAAARVIELKKTHADVKLVAAVPYTDHKSDYGTGDKGTAKQYRYVLSRCDRVVDVRPGSFATWKLMRRNTEMFEAANSSGGMCIAVKREAKAGGGTAHALKPVKDVKMCYVTYDPDTQKLLVFNK